MKFCISVPVGAYHDLLPYCLESLARQTAPLSVSLLDASGDPRVASLADKYAAMFSWRRSGRDAGQSQAIVEGWAAADGDILGWLNADDILYPNALAAVFEQFATNPQADVVFGHSAVCDGAMRMRGYHCAVSADPEDLRRGGTISQPSCFFRRTAYERVGGLDPELHFTMDWDLWLRLLECGSQFVFLDEPLSMVYWGAGTKTATFGAARRNEISRLIRRHAPQSERRRVFRGFATEAVLDAFGDGRLRRALRRAFGRNRAAVFGLGADGRIRSPAELRLFHLADRPRRNLRLHLSAGERIAARASAPHAVAREGRLLTLRFDKPLDPASTVSVVLTVPSDRPAYFNAAEWSDA